MIQKIIHKLIQISANNTDVNKSGYLASGDFNLSQVHSKMYTRVYCAVRYCVIRSHNTIQNAVRKVKLWNVCLGTTHNCNTISQWINGLHYTFLFVDIWLNLASLILHDMHFGVSYFWTCLICYWSDASYIETRTQICTRKTILMAATFLELHGGSLLHPQRIKLSI